ncbi:MAG: tRNA pseudouridine(13) synthase TruD [Pseudomonadota bacterium]
MSKAKPLQQGWAYALGQPTCHARIRSVPEDFIVDEVLGFDPDGEGNHAFLHIRKRNTNTAWLARQLAELAGVPISEVGYAGLKDRRAVTSQYFTVNLSGKTEPDWQQLASDDLQFLEITRHRRKLRRGKLRENRFCITLRDLSGDCDLEMRLQRIASDGVPNYFGEQRFGHGGNNLVMARAMFRGEHRERDRHIRGLYLSAARSWLFNKVLSARVEQGTWNRALSGESLIANGTTSAFTMRIISKEIEGQISRGALHPSGPLWGRGRPTSSADARALELKALEEEEPLCRGLERAGLQQERRPLRLPVKALHWSSERPHTLTLSFSLQPGAYATSVLREVVLI